MKKGLVFSCAQWELKHADAGWRKAWGTYQDAAPGTGYQASRYPTRAREPPSFTPSVTVPVRHLLTAFVQAILSKNQWFYSGSPESWLWKSPPPVFVKLVTSSALRTIATRKKALIVQNLICWHFCAQGGYYLWLRNQKLRKEFTGFNLHSDFLS